MRSGIYKITNVKNNKIYIGQSQDVYKRRVQHFEALKVGKHENHLMQKDFNKHKIYSFKWEVVELCGLKDLNDREKYWIDFYNSLEPNGYNQGWQPYKRSIKEEKPQYKKRTYRRTVKRI